MNIVIFEDQFSQNLSPLSLLKPVYDIRTGVFTNSERIKFLFGKNYRIHYHCREILSAYVLEIKKQKVNIFEQEDTLFINGRIIFKKNLMDKLIKSEREFIWTNGDIVFAAFLNSNNMSKFNLLFSKTQIKDTLPVLNFANEYKIDILNDEFLKAIPEKDFFIVNYPWDIVKYFNAVLNDDLECFDYSSAINESSDLKLINPQNIFISESAKIFPYTVLDATSGKIFIEDEVQIEPFTYIKGPAYIASKSIIKSGTKIYGPASIGFNSRVAGEISSTIFHSFVNKQHDGFIGNSYVAEFVNLGADTVTSNLKNNYSPIKARFKKDSIQHQTGLTFFGSIIGEHTKTGINTMLNTGSVIGIFALIAGGGFPDKFIDSFSWYITGKPITKYKIEEALHTARIVMSRREQELTPAYEKLIKNVYNSF